MNSEYIETIYTAVFYENEPINEIGIYGYRFKEPINADLFKAKPELNGKLFIINQKLLILLWHEDIHKTEQCFEAIDKILDKYSS
jgi:hypothetical protein